MLFHSLTPTLLPVVFLLWDCWTVNPQDSNVHRMESFPKLKSGGENTPTHSVTIIRGRALSLFYAGTKDEKAACSVSDSNKVIPSSPSPPLRQRLGTPTVPCSQSSHLITISTGGDTELSINLIPLMHSSSLCRKEVKAAAQFQVY